MKAEALLIASGQPYEVQIQPDPRKAPKAKLPMIIDDGETIPDSEFIRAHLETRYGVDFDAGLDARQRAVSRAMRKLCEEHLYWILLHWRWMDPANWKVLQKEFFGKIPSLLRPAITGQIRKQLARDMRGHGMGRHSPEEIRRLGDHDLKTLADFLGAQQFMMGSEPSSLDATACAFLTNILTGSVGTPLRDAASTYDNLRSYQARIYEHYFA